MDPKGQSIEEKHEEQIKKLQWSRSDVLYSFLGIYQIGIYVYYPKKCNRTPYTIKRKEGKFFDLEYLTTDERYEEYEELNKAIIESKFITHIDCLGNIIPIWPGGNTDKGKMSYCFDIPDIYFKKNEKWFLLMKQLYPNACLDGIADREFSTDDGKQFLDKMNRETYPRFLKHITGVIQTREEYLNGI